MPTLPRRLVTLLVLATLLAGCRLGVRAEVEVERDGSGQLALTAHLDDALLAELDRLGVDPTAELSAVATTSDDWAVTRTSEEGGLTVTLASEAADPAELSDALRELTADLSERDPGLAADLDLRVAGDGSASLDGTAELRPPIGPGIETDDAGAAELADLVSGSVDATLAVTFPGDVHRSDADEVDGRTATWRLPPGEVRTVSATAAVPSPWTPERIAALAAAAVVLVSAATVAWVLLRRRRPG